MAGDVVLGRFYFLFTLVLSYVKCCSLGSIKRLTLGVILSRSFLKFEKR